MTKQFVVARINDEGVKFYYQYSEFDAATVYEADKFDSADAIALLDGIAPDGCIYSIDEVYTNNISPE